jgi:hypothetical protein
MSPPTRSGSGIATPSTPPTTTRDAHGNTKGAHDRAIQHGIDRYWRRFETEPPYSHDAEIRELRELLDEVVGVVNALVARANAGTS